METRIDIDYACNEMKAKPTEKLRTIQAAYL